MAFTSAFNLIEDDDNKILITSFLDFDEIRNSMEN